MAKDSAQPTECAQTIAGVPHKPHKFGPMKLRCAGLVKPPKSKR
jgi:hypothetical protein